MGKSGSHKFLSNYLLVVAGDGGTGKTALVKQLILSHFIDEYDPTIEDSYRKQCVIDELICLLEVLDTAGQEEYSAMREQYIKNCEGIIIVYSITSRSSFEEVRVFYNQILQVRDNVFEDDGEVFPLCIVGNKCDLEMERQVSTAEGFALAKEFCCDFIETSAKSRINVDQCFYDLVRLIRTRRALKSIEIPGGYRGSLRLTIDLDWLFRRQKPGVLSQNLPIQEYVALTRQLVQAAKANDKRAVKKLLMKGADPDGYSESNGSAIYAAAAAGHANIVGLLLSRGAAVNARGPRGVTPLQVAAVEGHHEIVRVLLSKNVPVDEMSRMYGTALLGAASRVRLDVVRVLLEHGADVNATGGYEPYKKALHAAAVIGSIELAKLLLSSGAEIDARAPNGYTALETACHHGKAEIVRLLLERGAQPNLQSKKYGFELKIANDRGHYNVVKLLLDFGASDELVRDAARMPIQSTTPSPQYTIGQNGIVRAAEDSVSVNWPLPAAPLPIVSQIPTEPPSQITIDNGNERQQSSISPAVNPPTAGGNKHVIPEVRSSSVSRTWRFWKSKSDLVIQNGKGTTSPEDSEERCGLFELYSQPSNGQPAVDIVAVHGLGGHWRKTWSDSSGSLWLRDFLPSRLQKDGLHVRTMSYGYNSDTAFSKAVTNIEDEAAILLDRLSGARQSAEEQSRPIILIAHSLGGIIAKKAMIIAHEKSKSYGSLLSRVHAAVFFGVPHRGSDCAYWAYFAARLLEFGQLGFGTNSTYVSALRRNSKTFADISQQFIDRGSMFHTIRTYYETEKMGNRLIVDKDSARLGLPNEIAVGIAESNHRTMCKIDNVDSQKYKQISSAIQGLVQSALERPP